MKRLLISLMAIVTMAMSCTSEQRSPIEGAWEIVTMKTIWPDSTTIQNLDKSIDLIMFGSAYVTSIWQPNETTFPDSVEHGYQFASYSLEDGQYKEKIIYCNIPEAVGVESTGTAEFKDDTLILSFNDSKIYPDVVFKAFCVKYK